MCGGTRKMAAISLRWYLRVSRNWESFADREIRENFMPSSSSAVLWALSPECASSKLDLMRS